MKLLEGRYGPYVTDGTTNASVPKGTDPAALPWRGCRAARGAGREPVAKRPARRPVRRRKAAAGAAKAPRARKREPVEVSQRWRWTLAAAVAE